jgi:hypothetical protein
MSLNGCVHIQAPQLISISNFIQENLRSDTDTSSLWQLTLDDYVTEVSFLTISTQPLFVNAEQDIAVLDKFTINQLHLPRFNDVRIKIKDLASASSDTLVRTITVNDVLYETQECTPWQIVMADSLLVQHYPVASINQIVAASEMNSESIQIHQQSCQGATNNIHTVVLKNDNIQHITQYIPYFNQHITISSL